MLTSPHGPGPSPAAALSAREEQVLVLLAWGYSNKQIAARLGMSVKTIETYKSRGLAKTKVRGRTALVRYALGRGWLVEGGEFDPATAPAPDARREPAVDGLSGGGDTHDCNAAYDTHRAEGGPATDLLAAGPVASLAPWLAAVAPQPAKGMRSPGER